MKTLKSFGLPGLSILLSSMLLITSCKKSDLVAANETQPSAASTQNSFVAEEFASATSTTATSTVTYCSEKAVALCADGTSVGSVKVLRGSDNKIYVTYTAKEGYYFAQINLFAGLKSVIPNTLGAFTNKKTFSYPFSDQKYTFTLSGLGNSFSVVAYAILIKKSSYGLISGIKIAWGDGCSGKEIECDNDRSGSHRGCSAGCENEELVGGSYFNYTSTSCEVIPPIVIPAPVPVPVPVVIVEPDICSRSMGNFFGIHPLYGMEIPWSEPSVTIAGQTYTEEEARAIAAAPDVNGVPQDSKYAFQRVATLMLSNTDYASSPTLAPAVKNICDWLSTKGKLCPTNLPSGNATVKANAVMLDGWIDLHICPERR